MGEKLALGEEAVKPAVTSPGTQPAVTRRFFAGFELGTAEASEVMRGGYGTLIAVLGQYDVGKTCFLTSLYLLTACGGLSTDLAFAGSLTLNGFEARARRLRRWKKGALEKQMADHTRLGDARAPAMLHLGLRETEGDQRRFDLLVTDLPGEWSTDLVKDMTTASRFGFIHRADGIIITLDGPMLMSGERHSAAQNAKLLLSRLFETLKVDTRTPLVLMVTKGDEVGMKIPPIVTSIVDHAKALGFSPEVIPVAAISRTPQTTPSGSGVLDVLEYVLQRKRSPAMPASTVVATPGSRHFFKIRGLA